jgi:transposase InsO family protein
MLDYVSQNTDTEVVLHPPKSPNRNAYMERWFRSLKSEADSGTQLLLAKASDASLRYLNVRLPVI